ncbi:LysR family transcriptional regulator [Peribacillus asahii]|uniref:LysR family transcriptional regulator n=1 Tax=Peribacillus asahii TaxID=228899 RepID=UPI00207AD06D|nr:LysR family transcriptional regulator [Peribacillus asahii]USK68866.1 LysR family transcriptional regulator [Peribacillus asahii]
MIVDIMKVFVTVIEQKNFTRAAELLHISQPNVSLHIKNLENELGAKLIHRSPKQVSLTEAGVILYKHAKQILVHYEEAKHEIHDLQHIVTGKLRVGASFTIGEYILPKVLAKYAAQYPLVDIQTIISNTDDVIHGVRMNELDIGLIEGKADFQDLIIEPFMEDDMIIVAPKEHPLSQRSLIEKELLQNQVWILREQGSGTRTYMDRLMHDLNLTIKRSFIFSSNQGVKEAVKAGLGIALLSRWAVNSELETNLLHALYIKNHKVKRPFSVVKNKNAEISKALQIFQSQIEEFAL